MKDFAPYIAPALALFFIIRRGFTSRRVRPGALWTFPVVITLLCAGTLAGGAVPGGLTLAMYAIALAAGGALGWFTAQHVELTLDPKTGTIMSRATPVGTALTAGVFALRFALEAMMQRSGGHPAALGGHPTGTLVGVSDALLLFVAARGIARAAHMWIRTRPLVAQHKASQITAPPD